MTSEFFVWRKQYKEGFCVITNPQGFEKQYLLLKGIPLTHLWGTKVVCRMSPRYPKDIQLADNLYGGNYPVISTRLKEALKEGTHEDKTEYLPVSILNHKGRLASKDYYVVNPLKTIDCIDQEKALVKWNHIDPTVISSCKQLVLKEASVPRTIHLFRPKHMLTAYLIRRELATRLNESGFTGLYFIDPMKYRG